MPSQEDAAAVQARLTRELVALPEAERTRVVLGALALASDESRKPRRVSFDAIAAMAATVIAVASLVLAVDQTRIQRKQLAAAVWPSVRIVYSNFEDAEHPTYHLALVNGGVGPARIQAFSLRWHDKPVTDVDAWSRDACPTYAHDWKYGYQTGTLLSPGAQSTVVQHPRASPGGDEDRCVQEAMLWAVEARVCYCSALDDCWIMSSGADEPQPVPSCAEERKRPQFERN